MAWYVENGRLTHDDLPAPAEPMFIEPYPPGFWYTADEALTHAQLPEVFQLGAFLNCTKLKRAVIPESVKSIGEYAFSNTALTSVKIAGDCFYYDTSFPDGCEISYYSDYGEYTGAVPVQFRSDGSYLSDWSIKGNTVQNGTPSPSSPVDVDGCAMRTSNLFDKDANRQYRGYVEGYYLSDDNSEHLSSMHFISEYISVESNTTYTLSCDTMAQDAALCYYDVDRNYISGSMYGRIAIYSPFTFTTPANTEYIRFSAISSSRYKDRCELNKGNEALAYEPYGYKIQISNNSLTTDVYLGEVQSTRQIKKLVLKGGENWELQSGQTADYFRISNMPALPSKVFCTHYISPDENINYASTVTGIKMQQSSSYGVILACRPPNVTGLANFKSFLATQYANGTPVTVWYVLATPETATINEPLMKIGDYADSIDKAGAGVNIPTSDGINTLSLNTSVQPSEVYIKYNI